ncbi:IucA/IucC family C-terminal-domain containing protein, partial [Edwardsiella tarda]
DETLAPVAALGSRLPDGRSYLRFVLDQPGMPSLTVWWQEYCSLMAEVHLTLWLRYGIALESNQQNAMLSLVPGQPLTLMMKDNDAARLWPPRFRAACPDLAERLVLLRDERICVDDEQALAQMFITITLQLDLAAVLESLAAAGELERSAAYRTLRQALAQTLEKLASQGVETAFARHVLFDDPRQPVKYLLQSGSLLSKRASGAADINKFYGHSGPNFLRSETA